MVLRHDIPFKVGETPLYSEVKRWRSLSDMNEAIKACLVPLLLTFPEEVNESTRSVFFEQTYYKSKPEEEVKLLCWESAESALCSAASVFRR